MKPFNLADALAGKPVVTRDGSHVKIAGYDPNANASQKLLVWISGRGEAFYEKGNYLVKGNHKYDLFMAPEKREYWVALCHKNGYKYPILGNNKGELYTKAYADLSIIIEIKKIYEEEI